MKVSMSEDLYLVIITAIKVGRLHCGATSPFTVQDRKQCQTRARCLGNLVRSQCDLRTRLGIGKLMIV